MPFQINPAQLLIQMFKHIRFVAQGSFSVMVPQTCALCQSFTKSPGLCSSCWKGLAAISEPQCAACGRPLPYAMPDSLCAHCYIQPHYARPIRAGFCYNEGSRKLILPFKHGDRLDIAPVMARMLLPLFYPLASSADFVVPVPLHHRRYFKRRYNQSAEMARQLCIYTGMQQKFAPNLIIRHKNTRQMGGLSRAQRKQNVAAAFQITKADTDLLGKQILLIDDVMTTRETINQCARLLLKNGQAAGVSALIFARVV